MASAVSQTDAAARLAFTDESAFVRVGLLLLSTDLTTEQDLYRMRGGDRLRLHAARLEYANPVTPRNLRAMGPRLAATAALLPPDTPHAAVYFSCTSGSAVLGDDVVREAVHEAMPGVPVVTPLTAAVDAFAALGARRISILTPYTPQTTGPVVEYFERHGLAVDGVSALGLTDDRDMARLAPECIAEAAVAATEPESDALFVSCTALRSAQVAGAVEARTGRAVVTSNQAAAWRIFRLADLPMPDERYGRLMAVKPVSRPR